MKRAERTELAAIRLPESILRDLVSTRGKRSDFIVRATERALLELKEARALKRLLRVLNSLGHQAMGRQGAQGIG